MKKYTDSQGNVTEILDFVHRYKGFPGISWCYIRVLNGDKKKLVVICSQGDYVNTSVTNLHEELLEEIKLKLRGYFVLKPKIAEIIWVEHYTAKTFNAQHPGYFIVDTTSKDGNYSHKPVFLKSLSNQVGYDENVLAVSDDMVDSIKELGQAFQAQAEKQDVKKEIHKFSNFWAIARRGYYWASVGWFFLALVLASTLVAAFFCSPELQLWIKEPVFERINTGSTLTLQRETRDRFYPPNIGKAIILSTLLIWGIRISTKGGMTAIHLARKADEKATAANVYMSFLSDSSHKMTDDEVAIILKFLFSEAKTGLFKDEGPSLPLDICINTLRKATSSSGR